MFIMPNDFSTTRQYPENSGRVGGGRRRRNAVGTTRRNFTSGANTTPSENNNNRNPTSSLVVTAQPVLSHESGISGMAAVAIGAASLATTLTAAAIGTASPETGSGAISSGLAGTLGTAATSTGGNGTLSAASNAVTSAVVTAATAGTTASVPGSNDCLKLAAECCLGTVIVSGLCCGLMNFLGTQMLFFKSFTEKSEEIELSVLGNGNSADGESLHHELGDDTSHDGNSGNSDLTPLLGGSDGGLSEVVVTQPGGGGNRRSLRDALSGSRGNNQGNRPGDSCKGNLCGNRELTR